MFLDLNVSRKLYAENSQLGLYKFCYFVP